MRMKKNPPSIKDHSAIANGANWKGWSGGHYQCGAGRDEAGHHKDHNLTMPKMVAMRAEY